MARPAIEVLGVSKRYRLGQINVHSFREEIERLMFRRGDGTVARTKQDGDFWALKDVSFSVKPGEVIGIIGRNGAGKSTLLKILSRVTAPTEGEIRLRGRVASLLEVGTGFHPELTGRENIFLNGAILGMTRAEIARKFDEIIDFSGVEQFLDTPVKRYSSGMHVRLAFAVAAHLEPEILIIDEVLAVGDVEFQTKCLGKMREVSSNEGRTVLFVSHNLSAIRRLCNRALVLNQGGIVTDDDAHSAVLDYLQLQAPTNSHDITRPSQIIAGHDSEVELIEATVLPATSGETKLNMNQPVQIRIGLNMKEEVSNFHLYVRLYNNEDTLVLATADWDDGEVVPEFYRAGFNQAQFTIPGHLLNRGAYTLSVDGLVPSIRYIFRAEHVANFVIEPFGGAGGVESVQRKGVVRPLLIWTRRFGQEETQHSRHTA